MQLKCSYFTSMQWFLHGLLLFSFCCSSSVASSSVLVLFSGLSVSSTESSPSEGLALLVGDVTRPFTSGCPCEPGVMDKNQNTTEDRVSGCEMFINCTAMMSDGCVLCVTWNEYLIGIELTIWKWDINVNLYHSLHGSHFPLTMELCRWLLEEVEGQL